MTSRLVFFLLGLSARERLLLALLVLVALPLGLWLGLVQPMSRARDAARADLAEALELRHWLRERTQEAGRLAQAGQGGRTPPIGIVGLEQSLIGAGLRDRLTELTRRGGDAIEMRFDAVPFVALGDWITGASLDWGYEITALRIRRGTEAGLVAAQFTLTVPE